MTGTHIIQIAVMAFLILMSSYFSATETAFSSLNKTKLKALAEKGDRRAALACRLSDRYDRLLSTILIGNNIVNIASASIGTVLFVSLYGDIGATVSTVVMTVVVLIFGEITPKSLAKDSPEAFAMFSAPLINLLSYLLLPLNLLFSLWKKLLGKIFRVKKDDRLSHEELLLLVDEVEEDGSVNEHEGDLLRNVIAFTEQRAKDIMIHRTAMKAVPVDCTREELAQTFAETHFSRLPVYDEDIDHVIGIVHLKDFYGADGITQKPLRSLLTPVIYVSQSERIDGILRQLQTKKTHIAIVVDEYGGTCGMVTMEDILEELVGEILDEHDKEEVEVEQIGENLYRADGGMHMDDFCDRFDITPDEDFKSTSLGGWITEQLGQIPTVGSEVTYGALTLTVSAMEDNCVRTVTVRLHPDEEDEEKGKKEKEKEKKEAKETKEEEHRL